jgi:hypothetical protein
VSITVTGVLVAGLRWIYDTEQPAEALDQHHGVTSPEVNGRRYSFCPWGLDGMVVVVVDVARPVYLPGGGVENPLGGPAEVAGLVTALAALGRRAVKTWGGAEGNSTASVALAGRAHPTLTAAVNRYLQGCPTHDTVFCSRDGCRWFADGNALLVRPTWPGAEVPAGDTGDQP